MSPNVTPAVIAAVLAGGHGSRLGGDKAMTALDGRPLVTHALSIVAAAGLDAVVVAKPTTALPPLEVPVLNEPPAPFHPLAGILAALELHPAVVAVPCDMPFLPPALLHALAVSSGATAAGAIDGRLQPLPALVRATARPALERALAAEASVRAALQSAGVLAIDLRRFGDPDRVTFAVNTPADLARAELLLAG